MPELKSEAKTGIDIASEVEVLNYQYPGSQPIEVVARIDLGDQYNPLSGLGGTYQANVYLNGVAISPAGLINVPTGMQRTVLMTKPIAVRGGETVSLRARGTADDNVVNTFSTLRDVTAIKVSDVIGAGTILVDHNWGGPDALRAVDPEGVGVGGVAINAYLQADYDAGYRESKYIVARTSTLLDGRWSQPLVLDPGPYTLVYYKQGQFGPNVVPITVA
jgi:hypothetical protein